MTLDDPVTAQQEKQHPSLRPKLTSLHTVFTCWSNVNEGEQGLYSALVKETDFFFGPFLVPPNDDEPQPSASAGVLDLATLPSPRFHQDVVGNAVSHFC